MGKQDETLGRIFRIIGKLMLIRKEIVLPCMELRKRLEELGMTRDDAYRFVINAYGDQTDPFFEPFLEIYKFVKDKEEKEEKERKAEERRRRKEDGK